MRKVRHKQSLGPATGYSAECPPPLSVTQHPGHGSHSLSSRGRGLEYEVPCLLPGEKVVEGRGRMRGFANQRPDFRYAQWHKKNRVKKTPKISPPRNAGTVRRGRGSRGQCFLDRGLFPRQQEPTVRKTLTGATRSTRHPPVLCSQQQAKA